jgi:hypothetical protein
LTISFIDLCERMVDESDGKWAHITHAEGFRIPQGEKLRPVPWKIDDRRTVHDRIERLAELMSRQKRNGSLNRGRAVTSSESRR